MRNSLPTSHHFAPLARPGAKVVNNPLPPTGKSTFVSQFEFVGSVDNAPFLCIEEALRFRRDVCGGEEAIMKYCHDLARDGGRLVSEVLDTEVMDNEENTLTRQCCMVNIRLPLQVAEDGGDCSTSQTMPATPRDHVSMVAQYLTSACITDHHTFIAVIFYANAWWARFSAQVYLDLEDFAYGARALKSLCGKVAQGAYLRTRLCEEGKPTNED
jgi:hercynylcysteine S-oxide lyase